MPRAYYLKTTVQNVLPNSQTMEIGYNETATAKFYNRLKRGRVQGHNRHRVWFIQK